MTQADDAIRAAAAQQERIAQTSQTLADLRQRFVSAQSASVAAVLALLPAIEKLERGAHGHIPAGLAASTSELHADALTELRRLDEAAKVIARAKRDLRDSLQLTAEGRSHLVALAQQEMVVQAFRRDFEQMSVACAEGIEESEQDRYQTHSPYLQDSYLRDRRRLYDGGVFAAYQLNKRELMLARCELAKARGVLGWAVARHAGDHVPQVDQAERQLRRLDDDLASSRSPDVTVIRRRRLLWERLMMARGRALQPGEPPAFDLAAIQGSLAEDEAVIYHYWLSRTTLLTVTLDRKHVVADKTALGPDQRALLDSLLSQLDEISQLGETRRKLAVLRLNSRILEDRDLLTKLFPIRGRELLAGKKRLVLSPHGLLHQLPLHAFCLDDVPLIEDYAIRYVPNLTSLLLPARPHRPPDVLVMATSDLPEMTGEATAIAGMYRSAGIAEECLTDGQATAEHLNNLSRDCSIGRFTMLHLVAHGSDPPADEPFEACLRLADRKLDGLEISRWQLQADLVVLAACHSARRTVTSRGTTISEDLFGDEVFGLQAAFFSAGARQVLGAMWPAQDDVAAQAMTAFHRHLADSQPADIALRKAVLPLLGGAQLIYRWAPFKLICLGPVANLSPADLSAESVTDTQRTTTTASSVAG